MIIVSGTKRSGTSMWMQILKAAGVPVLGAEFSAVWKETIYDANPHGFYESQFRRGIYYQTNPNPKTGRFLHPVGSRGMAVKVFVPGLCRTDWAYLGRVIGTVRHWREYGSSLGRLMSMEKSALDARRGEARPEPRRVEPLLEWWLENYLLVRDIAVRGYPARLISYARVVDEPDVWIPRVLEWIGRTDSAAVAAAVAAVDPGVRTQFALDAPTPDLDSKHEEAFDTLYAAAHDGLELSPATIAMLNALHVELIDKIEAQIKEARQAEARRRAQARAKAAAKDGVVASPARTPASEVELIDALVNPSAAGD